MNISEYLCVFFLHSITNFMRVKKLRLSFLDRPIDMLLLYSLAPVQVSSKSGS